MRASLDRLFITCAVTGNLTLPEQTPHLPITPQEIAEACLGAADAGAAIVHIHVRDPATGRPSMELDLYRDVLERIRARNPQLIVNVTTGPGGRFAPSSEDPRVAGPGTTLMAPELRVRHIAELRPDICTLDLNTMTFGKEVVINTPDSVRRMAKVIREAGVLPEIELFDSGDVALLHDLLLDKTLAAPVLCSIVTGVKYGFQSTPEAVLYARDLLPAHARFTAFGVGRAAFGMIAQSCLCGGHVRVGLEDAVYLSRGVLAPSNADMVRKARRIVEDLGAVVMGSAETRELLGLQSRSA
ncbi:MAG TPA: 3-keto-5-aminohexanoate cleavage protein [Beijerinckiaceae bacterium]|nr:3-keto-5-aminohexanoate cleavage protein [Beijerinckiaceae bacterium]